MIYYVNFSLLKMSLFGNMKKTVVLYNISYLFLKLVLNQEIESRAVILSLICCLLAGCCGVSAYIKMTCCLNIL